MSTSDDGISHAAVMRQRDSEEMARLDALSSRLADAVRERDEARAEAKECGRLNLEARREWGNAVAYADRLVVQIQGAIENLEANPPDAFAAWTWLTTALTMPTGRDGDKQSDPTDRSEWRALASLLTALRSISSVIRMAESVLDMTGPNAGGGGIVEGIEALREAGGKAWDQVEDPEAFLGRDLSGIEFPPPEPDGLRHAGQRLASAAERVVITKLDQKEWAAMQGHTTEKVKANRLWHQVQAMKEALNLAWTELGQWERLAAYQREKMDQDLGWCPTQAGIDASKKARDQISTVLAKAKEEANGKPLSEEEVRKHFVAEVTSHMREEPA